MRTRCASTSGGWRSGISSQPSPPKSSPSPAAGATEICLLPPSDPGGDRPALRPPAGRTGVGHRAPAGGKTPTGAGKPRVTACGPLCGPMTGGAESLPLPAGFRPVWAGCGRRCGTRLPALLERNRRTKGKAGESPGAFVAPGRSLPPAVRAVSGNGG